MINPLTWFRRTEKYSDQPQQTAETQLRQVTQIGSRQAGVKVDERTALTLTAVYAAVRVLAETTATLPFPVYQSLEGGGKQRERNHPNYDILNVSPDGVISAVQWRETKLAHVLTHGNAFSEIEFTGGGDALACHLIPPTKVKPERTKSGQIEYKVQGSIVPIPAANMLHWAGLGFDGVIGYSPIKMAARAIGLGLACEAFGSAFFENGSKGGGVIKHPGTLSSTASKNLRDSMYEVHGGPDNFGKWMILEEGTDIQDTTIPPEEAQFLQTRSFQISEIGRLYRVPQHMIGDLSHATFSNIEQQSIDFVTNSIRPWCVRLEAEINRKLFSQTDRDHGYFAEHLVDGLLRGDQQARNAAYAIGRQWGWYCVDDIREWENLNPLPKGAGKIFLSPMNMIDTATMATKETEAVTVETTDNTVPVDPATPIPEVAPVTDIQGTALNGAQISSLLEIISQLSQGLIPTETARALIAASFPTLSKDVIDGMVDPLKGYTPASGPEAPQEIAPSVVESSRACLRDNVERMLRRESEAIKHASQKPQEFLKLIDHFYSGHKTISERAIMPSLKAFSEVTKRDLPLASVCDPLTAGRLELLELSGTVAADQLPATIESWLNRQEARADEIISSLAI